MARTNLDNSSCLFNLMCLPICCMPTSRWIVRTAYDIEGDETDDLFSSLFLPCCTVNQLYQTSKQLGSDSIGGNDFNVREYYLTETLCRDDLHSLSNNMSNCMMCAYSYFCFPLASAQALHDAMGMPYGFGVCCVTPCATRNLIRYHYRIAGDELFEELAVPGLLAAALVAATSLFYLPVLVPGLLLPQVYIESKHHGDAPVYARYLRTDDHDVWARYRHGASRAGGPVAAMERTGLLSDEFSLGADTIPSPAAAADHDRCNVLLPQHNSHNNLHSDSIDSNDFASSVATSNADDNDDENCSMPSLNSRNSHGAYSEHSSPACGKMASPSTSSSDGKKKQTSILSPNLPSREPERAPRKSHRAAHLPYAQRGTTTTPPRD
jgi:hypothetical protein